MVLKWDTGMPCVGVVPTDAANHPRWWFVVRRTCKRGRRTSTYSICLSSPVSWSSLMFSHAVSLRYIYIEARYIQRFWIRKSHLETPLYRTTFEVTGAALSSSESLVLHEYTENFQPSPVSPSLMWKLLLSYIILYFIGTHGPKSLRLRVHRSTGITFQKCNKDKMQIQHPTSQWAPSHPLPTSSPHSHLFFRAYLETFFSFWTDDMSIKGEKKAGRVPRCNRRQLSQIRP